MDTTGCYSCKHYSNKKDACKLEDCFYIAQIMQFEEEYLREEVEKEKENEEL